MLLSFLFHAVRGPVARAYLFLALVLVSGAVPLRAFNGHRVTEGPLTVSIAEIATVRHLDETQTFQVTLANSSPAPLAVRVRLLGLIDACRAVGETERTVALPGQGRAETSFSFACGAGTLSAHYPVALEASFSTPERAYTARAIQVFQTELPPTPLAESPVSVPAQGALALTGIKAVRVSWAYGDGAATAATVGWTGSDPASGASFVRGLQSRGGVSRASLQMHPPYRPRAGTVFAEFRLKLPEASPLRLEFFNAIRDSGPTEGTSDGVTFRVWANDRKPFERHTDSKTWVPGEVDLSAYAGQEVRLRLESHPGPRNNTVCDSSFWGDPVITAGPRPETASGVVAPSEAAKRLLSGGEPRAAGEYRWDLDGNARAVVVLGPNGLADGAIGFAAAERNVVFEGLHLAVREHVLGVWPSAAVVEAVRSEPSAEGRLRVVHRLRLEGRAAELVATIWPEGPALRIKVECPEYITGLGLNAADQRAPRVYYGHGYCIVEPEAFRASAGGHNLSTSHVGLEFERGLALLVASDTPPDYLQVDPDRRIYQLHTHPDATLTFVPGNRGAFDCALRYRPLSEKRAAAGVSAKAGRFVFDLWGGRYAENATRLARCFDYGLTNAIALIHVWQRWGYDYRLPDIFPPLPTLGTLGELQSLGELCRARGVRWGVHDNYIDFYPDADGFSYDHITFTEDGRPRRAWLNEGREAQSYQFRPDRIQPFLARNLAAMVPALRPTASFVDVFSSAPVFDFRDRAGAFHSKLETQRAWGEAFATIREALGGTAPTISEAGGDYLIGWLDGADAQFMQLGPRGDRFHNVVRCRDWERVPWFDIVHHTRFSLHGVGYSDRYQGGRSREEHGIESDDYVSAEILTGHALMIDRSALTRGAVRKYWLAQDFIARIAQDEIRSVEFAEGDLHRLVVTWQSGARVWVNRGKSDWSVEGRILPEFGFRAVAGDVEASVERIGPAIVEQSRAPGRRYVNGRVFAPAAPLAVTPAVDRVEWLGQRQFRMWVTWETSRSMPKELAVFYHFSKPTPGRRAPTEFVAGGMPRVPTRQWEGAVTTGDEWVITVPTEMPAGEYEILVGLYDPRNRGARERLLGVEDGNRRIRVGRITLEGPKAGAVTAVRLTKPTERYEPSARWLANAAPTDFGALVTDGAARVEVGDDHVVVTPLPDGPDFAVVLRGSELLGRNATAASVRALDARGVVEGEIPFEASAKEVRFRTAGGHFAYRIDYPPK